MTKTTTHDSADDRTLMAEERTFSAWVRTGLTAIATGLGIVKLLPDAEPEWIVQSLGIILVAVGGFAFAFGFWGYKRGSHYWNNARPRAVPLWLIGLFSLMLVLGSVLALALILVH